MLLIKISRIIEVDLDKIKNLSINNFVDKNSLEFSSISKFFDDDDEQYCKIKGKLVDYFIHNSTYKSCQNKLKYYKYSVKLDSNDFCYKCRKVSSHPAYLFILKVKIMDENKNILIGKLFNENLVKLLNII